MHRSSANPDSVATACAAVCIPEARRAVLTVPGLCCGNGAGQVRCALEAVQGVCDCETDTLTRSVHVAYDGARCVAVDLIATVRRIGYQVSEVRHAGTDGSPGTVR